MTHKWNLFVAGLVILAMYGMSAPAQDKTSIDEALKQVESGLANAGTRTVLNTSEGLIVTKRRYQLIGTDGCAMQIQMDVEDSQGGRTTFSKFLHVIPLSELDAQGIKSGRTNTGSPDPAFVTSLNPPERESRESVNLKLQIIGGRKNISYVVEKRFDWTSNTSKSQGRQSFFLINFKDKKAAEHVALAFKEMSRFCRATERTER